MLRFTLTSAAAAIAFAALMPGQAGAQPYPDSRYAAATAPNGWDRDQFWRGAPTSPRQRIDWLQRRIQRGRADGTLNRREAYDAQRELNDIRRMAMRTRSRSQDDMVQARLDQLSQRIRWERRDGNGYGYANQNVGGPGYRDPYATDYDATRYYRDGSQYQERRLSMDDQVYRGSDGRYYCKRNDGTTGLIVGAVGGGVLGNVIDGGHNRAAGTLIGGALGALAGKAIDQNSDVRCR